MFTLTSCCLLFFINFITFGLQFTCTNAKPTYSSIDYVAPLRSDYVYDLPYAEPLTNYGLRRLRRGYYFVEDGYISAISATSVPSAANRRQDSNGSSQRRYDDDNVRYSSLGRKKKTHTKHKKLFVPNFFG